MVAVATIWKGHVLVAGALLAGCTSQERLRSASPEIGTATTAAPAPTTTSPPALVPYAGDGFTILLPGPAVVEKGTANQGATPVEYTTVTAKVGSDPWSVTSFVRPPGFDQDDQARKVAEATGGTMADLRTVTVKGFRGRDFRVTQVKTIEGMSTIFNRSLLVKGRIYLVQAFLGGDHSTPPGVYRQVLESLSFAAP